MSGKQQREEELREDERLGAALNRAQVAEDKLANWKARAEELKAELVREKARKVHVHNPLALVKRDYWKARAESAEAALRPFAGGIGYQYSEARAHFLKYEPQKETTNA